MSFQDLDRILNKELSIIAGPASSDLANRIASRLNAELIPAEVNIFTDGESKVRLTNVNGRNCVIVQSTYPPTDRHILQMLMMIKKCKDDGAAIVCTVIPYMAYSRQDKSFLDGEVVSIKLIANLLEYLGTNMIVTVDIHNMDAISYFKVNTKNISAIPSLATYVIDKMKLDKPLVISPDIGGIKRAEQFASILDTEMIPLKKYRDRNTGQISITNGILDSGLNGRDVLIIDDMISSGMSVIKACELLKKNKSGQIYAICTHGLLLNNAKEKIRSAGVQDIITTNSIPSEFSKVDLSQDISENLSYMMNT